ncbi:SAM-dependent methyltransferase [Yinghuangia seranimata]|uniref:SAM-dependent methyltransferase n=1 Tax=Yinghuangia seranimata TaxID=408067 RepID=UPI00248CEDF0|nr:cyclopropane-fatty-acyl-phospholipid synthase family protein [Yinghuangia seranimata]MDI2128802.1 cyclopropane-fatty-acyl-phospholipid synthase family protein [Yinghuangia seranimata]
MSTRTSTTGGAANAPTPGAGSRPRTRGTPEPAAGRWPGLATVPDAPARARIAKRLFAHAVRDLKVRVHLPSGRVIGGGGFGDPVMRIERPDEFYRRIGAHGLIGFGEAWMTGAWDADDPTSVLTVFARRLSTLVPPSLQRLRRWAVAVRPADEENTPSGARGNISRHYDLSNDLFALFLDETMTYSSALFEPGDDLRAAQRRKIDAVLDAAAVRSGTHVLEIGTGWGELALRAAERGARVTTITLSDEQRALARRRLAQAGVADQVDVLLCDYREVSGTYDAVVSVEMIEAVGERYWPAYFAAIDRALVPGGRACVQAITMADDRMRAARDTWTWMHKYVFPGGLIPSPEAIDAALAEHTRLQVVHRRDFGAHYAETLHAWRDRFVARAAEVTALGFDTTFQRMWEFYLAYCEAGFRSGYLGVSQFTLARQVR